MRWFDAYLGLVSAGSLYGAVLGWVRGTPEVAVVFLAIAGASLVTMVVRAGAATRILVVGDSRRNPQYRLHDALDDAGFATRSCPGPAHRACPVWEGKPCPIRRPVAAAVIVQGLHESGPIPPCEQALGIRAVSFREEPFVGGAEERGATWAALIVRGLGAIALQRPR